MSFLPQQDPCPICSSPEERERIRKILSKQSPQPDAPDAQQQLPELPGPYDGWGA